ncbi:hypothetical protein GQ43DRAFT_142161 [Delitschia confertaspora ATCC 74209]|uniref:RING-type domain-containing protein n=1 Tax=Delitschia confertaspora ATCC 74209 TaxID=1513339 RepID=A0A9P4JSR4_9PLEO|nr:hypothetical protein GQ43DRAFT_142161 [Delitschia confertaspora ATCC 74209]
MSKVWTWGDSPNNELGRYYQDFHYQCRKWQGPVDGDCPICEEPLNDSSKNPIRTPECAHDFHAPCLVAWMKENYENPNCPLCRAKLWGQKRTGDAVIRVAEVESQGSLLGANPVGNEDQEGEQEIKELLEMIDMLSDTLKDRRREVETQLAFIQKNERKLRTQQIELERMEQERRKLEMELKTMRIQVQNEKRKL